MVVVMSALFVLGFLLGPLLALGGAFLSGASGTGRRAYGFMVAGLLLVAAALAASRLIPRADVAGAMPWVVAAIVIPVAVAAFITLAIRDERGRDAFRWVPAAVLAGFPAFVFTAAITVLSAADS